jgi:ABC-type sugar transport system permease subunit
MENSSSISTSAAKKIISGVSSILKYIIIIAVDLILGYFTYRLVDLDYVPLAIVVGLIILLITVSFLIPKLRHLKWMSIGLSAWLLFSIFPILFTIYNGFTNYGDGHLISKALAIEQISKQKYLPETGKSYEWVAFRSDTNDYLLWLKDTYGNTTIVRMVDADAEEHTLEVIPGENGIGELDDKSVPKTIEGYTRLNKITASTDANLTNILFGEADRTIQVRSPSEAAELLPLYEYDPDTNIFTDVRDGKTFREIEGTWTATDGTKLIPGYTEIIGFDNFVEFATSPGLRGPLVIIVVWNFIFATMSLVLTFGLGLLIAVIYSDPNFKGKKILRSLLLIPYTIPSLITILIWRGMLNPDLGIVNRILEATLGISPDWFNNRYLARIAILIVNTWLGYPYWMLVTSGALQSIPTDIYEAAEVDGATGWQRFWRITLPLLLVSVGPLMISSFIFNFNNFNLIYAFINGGPPIPTATTTAGYSDIIISYVYNLAFASGRGIQYGYASAISFMLFILIAVMALTQFRLTNMWEEVGENA